MTVPSRTWKSHLQRRDREEFDDDGEAVDPTALEWPLATWAELGMATLAKALAPWVVRDQVEVTAGEGRLLTWVDPDSGERGSR